jgi:hypothetical protein
MNLTKIKAYDNFKKLPPIVRKTYMMVGLIFLGAVVLISSLFSSAFKTPSDEVVTVNKGNASISISQQDSRDSVDGTRVDDQYKKTLLNDQKEETTTAIKKGGSYVPNASLVEWKESQADSLEKDIDKNLVKEVKGSHGVESATKQIAYRSLNKEQLVHYYEQKATALTSLRSEWDEPNKSHSKSYELVKATSDTDFTLTDAGISANASEEDKPFVGMVPGEGFDVAFNFATNTDVTKNMVADILNGPFKGGTVTSSVVLNNGFASYVSKYITYKGRFFKGTAVLIDSQSEYGSTGFSDDTDWHRLYRYGNLFLAGIFGPLPEMVLRDGQSSISVNGVVVSEKTEYENKDYIIAAAGGVGQQLAAVSRKNFDRQETVYVKKHHFARLVFIEPAEVPWMKNNNS